MNEHILTRLATKGVHFVLPRAPSGSWYDAKAVAALTPLTKFQVVTSLQLLRDVIEELPKEIPLLLAGFSQGACLALEYALAFGPWRGGLVCFTGCRVGAANDDRPKSDLNGLPVYLSGSNADPWIPVSALAEATAELANARARLRCDIIPGRTHEVSSIEVATLDAALAAIVAGQETLW
jgi:phospholipase/carboxylesterase